MTSSHRIALIRLNQKQKHWVKENISLKIKLIVKFVHVLKNWQSNYLYVIVHSESSIIA